jgi:hypothetical protein
VTRLKSKPLSVHLEIVQILMQDRCTICVERIIGSIIIFDAPNGTPRRQGARFAPNIPWAQKSFWTHQMELLNDVGHVESHFGLFGYKIGAWFALNVA